MVSVQIGKVEVYPLGDSVLVVNFQYADQATLQRVINAFGKHLDQNLFAGLVEYIPALTTVSVVYDPLLISYKELRHLVMGMVSELEEAQMDEAVFVKIPVCYEGEFGPDLEAVAKYHSLTVNDVIEIHSRSVYVVRMMGFSPCFPYLSGLSERIAMARLATPRLKIPAGSIGIAGHETGVYPIETPGGWQLIGRTPLSMFSPSMNPPCFLKVGDKVQFVPISRREFDDFTRLR